MAARRREPGEPCALARLRSSAYDIDTHASGPRAPLATSLESAARGFVAT